MGAEQVENWIAEVPNEIMKEVMDSGQSYLRQLSADIKARAPKASGALKHSSLLFSKGKKQLTITIISNYAYYQEMGFKPHYVNLEWPSKNEAGDTIASAMRKGRHKVPEKGYVFVKKSTPFIGPAFDSSLQYVDRYLNEGVGRAINKK